MKKQVLGFTSIAQLVNNVPGANSVLGELSTWSQTFSLDKGEYVDPNTPGYRLTTFSVKDSVTGLDTSLTTVEARLPIRMTQAMMTYSSLHPAPLDPVDFRDSIQADFFLDIENLVFGELETGSGSTLPTWFTYTEKAGDKNECTIWLADAAFAAQYPEYDITIIPPLPNVIDFLGGWQTAVNKLPEWNNIKLIEELQYKKNLNPETYVRYFEFDFVNKLNPTQKVKTSWYVLVYGEAGDFEDAIKDAIVKMLVDETGRPEQDWEPVFPELFKRTEFILYPRWDLQSIPNMSTLTGLYSPFVPMVEGIDYAVQYTPFYNPLFVKQNCTVFPITYKSLSVVAVNGENNIPEQTTLIETWPDYIAVASTTPDFQRMQVLTQNWVHLMIRMMDAAEKATGTSALPQGMRRTKRGDHWYISSTFNKATYLVSMRRNFPGI